MLRRKEVPAKMWRTMMGAPPPAVVPARQRRGSHVGAQRRAAWKRNAVQDHPYCSYCGCEVGIGKEFGATEATVDHVQPLAKNGLDREDNWALACAVCNQSKGKGKFTVEKRRALVLALAKRGPS